MTNTTRRQFIASAAAAGVMAKLGVAAPSARQGRPHRHAGSQHRVGYDQRLPFYNLVNPGAVVVIHGNLYLTNKCLSISTFQSGRNDVFLCERENEPTSYVIE